MNKLMRGVTATVLVGVCFAVTGATWASGRAAHAPQAMSPVRALNDDKCDAACDAASDKCAIDAGKDATKQRQCDASYEACLRKCQGPG